MHRQNRFLARPRGTYDRGQSHTHTLMTTHRNPLIGWQVDRSQISTLGVDLQRPECILAEPDGTLWTADARGVMRIAADGTQTLVRQQGVAERALDAQSLILGGIPDGFAFDAFGNLWITLIMAERLVALTPEGELPTLLDDGKPEAIAAFDRHFYDGTMTPEVMATCQGTLAPWMASLTFGGPDLRTVYLGSLMGTTLPYFRSPVAGQPLSHWRTR